LLHSANKQHRGITMKQWLRRKLNNFLNGQEDDWVQADSLAPLENSFMSQAVHSDGIHFAVLPARGGTIVLIRRYGERKNNGDNTVLTYVIAEGDDIRENIANIVSMEMMK